MLIYKLGLLVHLLMLRRLWRIDRIVSSIYEIKKSLNLYDRDAVLYERRVKWQCLHFDK